jgi:hypothetical protein
VCLPFHCLWLSKCGMTSALQGATAIWLECLENIIITPPNISIITVATGLITSLKIRFGLRVCEEVHDCVSSTIVLLPAEAFAYYKSTHHKAQRLSTNFSSRTPTLTRTIPSNPPSKNSTMSSSNSPHQLSRSTRTTQTSVAAGSTVSQPSGSRTLTLTHAPPTNRQPVLHLRGVEVQRERTGQRPGIRWAEDVVDNEGMGRKKSKGTFWTSQNSYRIGSEERGKR